MSAYDGIALPRSTLAPSVTGHCRTASFSLCLVHHLDLSTAILHEHGLPLQLPCLACNRYGSHCEAMLPTFQEWLTAAENDDSVPRAAAPPPPPPSSSQLPVLVVGAGPGGLCVMAELSRRSIPFVGIEQHTGVGGIWDTSSAHSSVYEGLTCNGSSYSMTLDKHWDMPADDPLFPNQRHVLRYLNTFADKHNIGPHCRFGCRVEQSTFDNDKQCWVVRYKVLASGEVRTESFSELIAASGLNGRSSGEIPADLQAKCEAAQVPFCHVSAVKQPAAYANKRVLIVGLSISGSDLAAQLAQHAERVFLSVRSPTFIVPQTLWGKPLDALAGGDLPNVAALPQWLASPVLWAGGGMLRWMENGMAKSWAEFGMKKPKLGAMEKFPPVSRWIVLPGSQAGQSQAAQRRSVVQRWQGALHHQQPESRRRGQCGATTLTRSYSLPGIDLLIRTCHRT